MTWRTATSVGLALMAIACSASQPGAGPAASSTTPFTGPTDDLAPSQRALPTVAAPPAPGQCDVAELAVDAELGGDDAGVVVTFRNASAWECEVDLGTEWAIRHDVEPSVWLAAGATAELWGAGTECAPGAAAAWRLHVNDRPLTIELPAGAPCDVVPTAFFPT